MPLTDVTNTKEDSKIENIKKADTKGGVVSEINRDEVYSDIEYAPVIDDNDLLVLDSLSDENDVYLNFNESEVSIDDEISVGDESLIYSDVEITFIEN